MTNIEELKEEIGGYKTYFCGCKSAPRTTPDHCPEHSLPAVDFDGAWEAVSNDENLKSIRRKLSIHELRTLFNVSSAALVGCECDYRVATDENGNARPYGE